MKINYQIFHMYNMLKNRNWETVCVRFPFLFLFANENKSFYRKKSALE